ncbi:MAG: hypothetical protein K0S78_3358 [Thermomicrobiales bacterium]|jgi:hypothetical protein|nr:hypothetical protein [Thermomicrobiales bacterium]
MTEPHRSSIVITVAPSASTMSQEITDLAQALKELARDHDMRIEREIPPPVPPRDSRIKYRSDSVYTIDALTTIAVSVPWEALTGAVAAVVLEGIRDWTVKRVQRQKQVLQERAERAEAQVKAQRTPLRKLQDRLRPKPSVPEKPATPEINLGFRRIPRAEQLVNIYGPQGQLLAVVHQDQWQESPSVDFGAPPT